MHSSSESGNAQFEQRVEDFVRRTYIHGVPYRAAVALGREAAPILEDWLSDPGRKELWPNIVVVLGMVGGAEAGYRLIRFAADDEGSTLSAAEESAKQAALMSVGYVVNHTADLGCLNYLVRASDPSYWRAQGLAWRATLEARSADRDTEMATQAMLGLALSGHPEAIQALERMRQPQAPREVHTLRDQRPGLLEEAIRAAREIRESGLEAYYEKGRKWAGPH